MCGQHKGKITHRHTWDITFCTQSAASQYGVVSSMQHIDTIESAVWTSFAETVASVYLLCVFIVYIFSDFVFYQIVL